MRTHTHTQGNDEWARRLQQNWLTKQPLLKHGPNNTFVLLKINNSILGSLWRPQLTIPWPTKSLTASGTASMGGFFWCMLHLPFWEIPSGNYSYGKSSFAKHLIIKVYMYVEREGESWSWVLKLPYKRSTEGSSMCKLWKFLSAYLSASYITLLAQLVNRIIGNMVNKWTNDLALLLWNLGLLSGFGSPTQDH